MKRREREEARRLRAEGASLREIARTLGVALSSASVWTRDVPVPVRDVPAAEVEPAQEPRRRCSRCGLDIVVSGFNRGQWWCRDCFRRYYRADVERHRRRANALKRERVAAARAVVLDVLGQGSCADCGEVDPVVLEFDHVDVKCENVATLVTRGVRLERLRSELERCEIVCVNCHRRRTARRAAWRRLDGDLSEVPWRSPRHERNVRHVFSVLEAGSCVDCGEGDMCVLDFDHRGAKTGMVMRMARNEVSLERLRAEIARCELRCANCHRRRTAAAAAYFKTRREEIPPTGIEPVLQA